MALIDLSLVTRSLKKLLEKNINKVILGSGTIVVTPEAPDKVGAVLNRLSLYMYHVGEEAHYKNYEGFGSGDRSIARTPMALCLYYVLTAHHESPSPEDDPLTQQTLLGYALKTLHDYPIVHDDTVIDGDTILQGAMYANDNPMQIIMRPVTVEESISFWGAEDQQTTRLSAYYEVRVVLLEPDEPTTMVAPVLSLGTYLYQLGVPHLEHTTSELPFSLPTSAGGATQIVPVTPGRVAAQTGADPVRNRLLFAGHNLTGGQSRQLWLRSKAITAAVGGPLPVDMTIAANVSNGWTSSVEDGQLVLDIHSSLAYLDDADVEQNIALLPGIYTAFLRVTVQQRVVNNVVVPITNDSNEVSFAVIPRLDESVTIDGPNNKVTVSIIGTFDLSLPSLEVRLYVDGQAYTKKAGTPAAGEYEILDSTDLIFHALFDVETDGQHPARLVVNGAESAPFWIETSTP